MSAVLSKPPMPSILYVDPLFDSAHQALLFAYTFSANQHATAAVAERQVAMQGRERYERDRPVRRASKGLSGLDGAAQAGMIKAVVERQRSIDRFHVEARFAVLNPAVRRHAWRTLAFWYRSHSGIEVSLGLSALFVLRCYGAEINLQEVADARDLKIGKLIRQWMTVRDAVRAGEDRAMGAVIDALRAEGITE